MGNCQQKAKKVQDPSPLPPGTPVNGSNVQLNADSTKVHITIGVFGLDDAGKTTITKQLQFESVELVAPTVGFSRAEIEIPAPYFTAKSPAAKTNKNLQNLFRNVQRKLVIYDLGGGVRIREIWKNYLAEIHAAVFVVDAGNTERIAESSAQFAALLNEPSMKGKPILLFANKQDKPSAKQSSDLAINWKVSELSSSSACTIETVECVAIGDKMDERISKGLRWLLGTIEKEFETLDQRVQLEAAEQRKRDEEEKIARRERVRKAREERERLAKEQAEANGVVPDAASKPNASDDKENEANFVNPFQPIDTFVKNAEAQSPIIKAPKKKPPKPENNESVRESYATIEESPPVTKDGDQTAVTNNEDLLKFNESSSISASNVRLNASTPTGESEHEPETQEDSVSRRPSSTDADAVSSAPSTGRKKKGGMRNIFKKARVGSIPVDSESVRDSGAPATPQKSDDEGRSSELGKRPEDEEAEPVAEDGEIEEELV